MLGSATLGAVQALLARRGDEGRRVLLGMITAQQSVRYLEIAERNPSQEAFEFGWQLNRAIGAGLPSWSQEFPMLAALLPALVPILGDAIRRLFPDPAEAAKAQAELNNALMANAAKIEDAAASIIADEAKSEHWLASSWRPLVMLTFTALIANGAIERVVNQQKLHHIFLCLHRFFAVRADNHSRSNWRSTSR